MYESLPNSIEEKIWSKINPKDPWVLEDKLKYYKK